MKRQIHVSLAEEWKRKTKAWFALMSNNKSRSIHKGKDLINWRKAERAKPFLSCLSLRITQPLVAEKNNVAF